MLYTAELLDRSTGDLRIVDLGNWITVTEFGQRYGIGPKKVRSVLHHLGMLQTEGKRLRLTPKAVALGYGRRHDFPQKQKYPFDVISPLGQKVIAQNLGWVMEDMDQDKRSKPQLQVASQALESFKVQRLREMTTQMEVCWMRDHFPELTQDEIAGLIDAPQSLVNRYATTEARQRDFHQRRKAA
jgi:hypothetical protein